jgi:hypothetical protein
VKTFLGQSGRFNGEDIIDIIVGQQATGRFICRHLYNFFVADEPPVSAWSRIAPEDTAAVEILENIYAESGGDIRSILRVLFNSVFFKEARFKKIKSPAELVAGTVKLAGTFPSVQPGFESLNVAATNMGQQLMNPPTVEGWHTGKEWINGATLNERINFAVDQMKSGNGPVAQGVIDSCLKKGGSLLSEELVNLCLKFMGLLEIDSQTRDGIMEHEDARGKIKGYGCQDEEEIRSRVTEILQLIVSSTEYQFS